MCCCATCSSERPIRGSIVRITTNTLLPGSCATTCSSLLVISHPSGNSRQSSVADAGTDCRGRRLLRGCRRTPCRRCAQDSRRGRASRSHLRRRRSHFADRLAHALGAVLGLRMRRQPVRCSVAIGRLGDPRERRQKLGYLLRIPSALGRVLCAQRIGLQLVVSSKLQEQDAGAGLGEIGKRPYLRDKDAADEHAELSAHPRVYC